MEMDLHLIICVKARRFSTLVLAQTNKTYPDACYGLVQEPTSICILVAQDKALCVAPGL